MSQQHDDPTTGRDDDPTIGRIVADITRDLNLIVQHQVDLAKREVITSAKVGGIGAAMFAVAGFLGLLVIILLSIAFAHLLSMTGLHLAWCYLIVAGAYVLLGVVLVLVGVRLIKKVKKPEQSIEAAKKIPAALKGQTSSAGAHRAGSAPASS
ncbi:phage holin family protein [Aeromicrobium sp. CTD01-1L150]|uniref:phage holin family protein n=1 Tax=Aeromicrobium sp. CTD01-1L150 TaxID=3341830 RepID=UPI0035C1E801